MIQIARSWRTIAGGVAAGVVGVVMVAGGTASAEPMAPQPVVPGQMQSTPPGQNATVFPGGVNSNRLAPAPAQVPAAIPAPLPATAPVPAAAPVPPVSAPAVTGTLREYLEGKGVKLEPQRPLGFKALDITVPMPPRWTQVPDPNVPDAFVVIADRVGGNSVYTSNAQVVVYKLVGNFDPAEAITHGFVDSQRLLAWQTTNASQAPMGSFPSSVIEGTYRENDMTLNTSRRHVIANSGTEKYLVSFAVTTAASQAVADGPATDAIISGFRVSAPGAPAQAPAAPAPAREPGAASPQAPATQAPAVPVAQAPVAQAPALQAPAVAAPQSPAQPPVSAPVQPLQPAPRALAGQGRQTAPTSNPAQQPPLVTVAPSR
ncbi:LpqN/LpqT family lipoprotein [Mycobacterium vicinigordonae]|uniref:LpqN/LpqT family lipoprotein n=1 Tax=Mycobacterium vicinigordonae TaxID=1719132 RepID=A0A7D6DYE3_9MYCO|nr:LpqN/LpqT family lipoprotein [Mycobacterium vicinigordonae]QLL07508.1 LpqN/LpqT family lipoprotein [Mycobacterium vicinigordonae]